MLGVLLGPPMIEELRAAGFVLASRMILLRGARGIPYRLYLDAPRPNTPGLY